MHLVAFDCHADMNGRQAFATMLCAYKGDSSVVVGFKRRMLRAPSDFDPVGDIDALDAIAVCASDGLAVAAEPRVLAWLRVMARRGVRLGAIDGGSHLLAAAGLLDGYRATIHSSSQKAFAQAFPRITATANPYEIDRDRFSCGDATAGLNMPLHIIALEQGVELAWEVSERLVHARLRHESDNQCRALTDGRRRRHPRLDVAVAATETAIDVPLPIAELATRARVTVRQLERLFEEHFDCSPSRYYANLRLSHARNLLNHTDLPTLDVAMSCGFRSYAHFSRSFKSLFGHRRSSNDSRATGRPMPPLTMSWVDDAEPLYVWRPWSGIAAPGHCRARYQQT